MEHDLRELKEMGRTERASVGDGSQRAVVQVLDAIADDWDLRGGAILDFGAGTRTVQADELRAAGWDVTAYEWPALPGDASARSKRYRAAVRRGALDPMALAYSYDIVLGSNVLNVQPSWESFWATLAELVGCMGPNSILIVNLSDRPRRLWSEGEVGAQAFEDVLLELFGVVYRVKGTSPTWVCQEPKVQG